MAKMYAPFYRLVDAAKQLVWWKPKNPQTMSEKDYPTPTDNPGQWGEVVWTPQFIQQAFTKANTLGYFDLLDVIILQLLAEDDRYTGALQQRAQGLTGLPVYFNQDGNRSTKKTRVERALEEDWSEMIPEDCLEQLHQRGTTAGFVIGSYQWEQGRSGRYIPKMRFWSYTDIRFLSEYNIFQVNTKETGWVTIDLTGDNWFIFQPYGPDLPWNYGLWRRLSYWVLAKRQVMRNWAHYSEVCGFPTWILTAAEGWNSIDRVKAAIEFTKLGRDKAVGLPKGVNASVLEVQNQAWAGFQQFISECNMAIVIGVMSQNLTSEVSQGARASTVVHAQIANNLLKSDANKMALFLHDNPIKLWTEVNFGDRVTVPWCSWDTTPPMDMVQRAQAHQLAIQNAKEMLLLDPEFDTATYLGEQHGLPISPGLKSNRIKNVLTIDGVTSTVDVNSTDGSVVTDGSSTS